MIEVYKQGRTNRETGLESIVEAMHSEDCGQTHGTTKRKKKVKETDDPNVKQRTPALFKKADTKSPPPDGTVTCDKCNGDGCDHCNGTGKHVVKEAGEPAQNTAGYIQIDLYTGGVQTISPDSVNQAIEGLKHVPAGAGESDWDAWTGEEYMIVAVPKTVHWPQTQAYDFADTPKGTGQYNPTGAPRRQSQSPHSTSGTSGLGM